MFELLDFTAQNIIATKADDQLRRVDYEKIYPLVHNILLSGKKVRWYLEIENFNQWSDNSYSQKIMHTNDFEKIGCVGAIDGDKRIMKMLEPFKNAEILFFSIADKEMAKSWIRD
ncbi:MAG: STAS/SEC14 domain-containing protein [Bacteroidota bacterium]|jgi:hypothetical protein|uniref:STAS/SEC14 domain-containing protein n=1 Tax=Sediminibacterium sp. TaxID=1917865 RepID=UPI000BDDAACB|nr:STAS/SEC14 domain-containing protein [Sediminibacterium sp.]OYZ55315.1 MAG: hypothetical protein B7Y11_01455 [Sphingobacteriia bacterium 24-36-13]OZA66275.1 MAG: hypothetical protein B7X68_00940 [Sphingobacteriia bacterium 39-36-14]HQS22852.1 STAS/SEC14 domain-containing protein [Sediminibacterium sp.]HQS33971.1 STAS/SEC14 domain-containing protein [Sediminibacterium sp.]